MKKNIVVIIVLFMLFLPNIKALENDSYIDWTLDRSIFVRQYKNGKETIENLAIITANGKIAYCIQPGVMADKGSYYNSTYNIKDTGLSDANLKRISLIGYYAYGYNNHDKKEYYMAAQELIWKIQGVDEVIWSDSKYNGNIINIESYKNEILSLVDNYEIAPNFSFEENYILGDEITINDNNNILNEYELKDINHNISINNNHITIKITEDNSFILQRKKNQKSAIFYYKNGYQTIGTFEYPYDYEKEYNVKYTYGKATLNKLDYDSKSKTVSSSYATLSGAKYRLYNHDNTIIKDGITNKDGVIIFDLLPKGKYFIKEINPSKGYTLNNEIYEVNIDSKNKTPIIKCYEKKIKGKVNIKKVLNDEKKGIMTPEEGITFELYDNTGNLLKEYITDKDGLIKIELPYGKYILKQVTSPINVDKVEDTYILVEDENNQNITLVNNYIQKLPKTGKMSINIFVYFIISFIFSLIGFIYPHENKIN